MPKHFLVAMLLMTFLHDSANAQATFPLRISNDKRYLEDQRNNPFPILGRTAWFIISQPEK
jgi:hypothetical protein